jgi:CPA2 family monovalent cation:H+ antiporter-2
MLVVGRRAVPAILHYVAHTGSRELFRLAVLSLALVLAFLAAELFGVSIALGAFFAGMLLHESELSQRAAEESLPLRDAFAVLFFVSIGMLFDPVVILRDPVPLIGCVLVVAGTGGIAFLLMRAFAFSPAPSLTVAAGLAQIGEFSFILVGLGTELGLLPVQARDLVLGTSIISIFLNPLIFAGAERLGRRQPQPPAGAAPAAQAEEPPPLVPTALHDHAVLVGYGRVGRLVAEGLRRAGWPLFVIETGEDSVKALRAETIEAVAGNAAEARVLAAANLPQARLLVVAIPDGFEAGQIVQKARAANPTLEIIARAHFDAEVEHLERFGANTVIMGEREIAQAMLEHSNAVARPNVPAGA